MGFLKRRWKGIALILLTIMIALPIAFSIYVLDFYEALPVATEALKSDALDYVIGDNMIVFEPEDGEADKGIIFYPGGKVDYLAYAPLMKRIAKEGYICFLMEMPLNLAVLGQEAADQPMAKYEDIESWYMAGHSLGGAMASIYTSKHKEEIDGLILLGAYPAADLSGLDIHMLSIYGSEDEILSKEKAQERRAYGPANSTYFEIKGGNHAYYGSYGEQKKDGKASISEKEQQEITTGQIKSFIENN